MKPSIRWLLLFALVLGCLCTPFSPFATADEDKKPPVKDAKKEILGKDEKALLDLLNDARKKEKLEPLQVSRTLCKIALLHTKNMAEKEKMAHQLDGKGVGDRTDAGGYDYKVVRENLAMAEGDADTPPSTPKEIHDRWMDSKGHRANILDAKVTEVGIAIVRSKKGTYYYTQVFAAPRK